MNVGDQDGLRVDVGKLHDVFSKDGIENSFEVYSGVHTSAVAYRFQIPLVTLLRQSALSTIHEIRLQLGKVASGTK